MSKFECEDEITLPIKIVAEVSPYYEGSYYQPPEPASIEDMEIEIYGIKIEGELYDKIMTQHWEECERMVWDQVEEEENEMARSMAEDLAEARDIRNEPN